MEELEQQRDHDYEARSEEPGAQSLGDSPESVQGDQGREPARDLGLITRDGGDGDRRLRPRQERVGIARG